MFSSDEVRLLAAAFDKAWSTVELSGAYLDHNTQLARDLLARHIIKEAHSGERDEQVLCDGALAHLAQNWKFTPREIL